MTLAFSDNGGSFRRIDGSDVRYRRQSTGASEKQNFKTAYRSKSTDKAAYNHKPSGENDWTEFNRWQTRKEKNSTVCQMGYQGVH